MGYDTHTIVKVSYNEKHEALVLATWLQNEDEFDFDIEDKTLSFSLPSRNFYFSEEDLKEAVEGTLLEQLNLDWVEEGVAEVSGYTDDTWNNLYEESRRVLALWRKDPTKADRLEFFEVQEDDNGFEWDYLSEFVNVVGDCGCSVYWDIYRDEDDNTLLTAEGTFQDGYVEEVHKLEEFLEEWFQEEQERNK